MVMIADLEGTWDNGECKTNQNNQSGHGSKLDLAAGITYYGIGAVPGFSISSFLYRQRYHRIYNNCELLYHLLRIRWLVQFLHRRVHGNVKAILQRHSSQVYRTAEEFLPCAMLSQPFQPFDDYQLSVPVYSSVSLKVYDVLGREVQTLVNERQTAGGHS